MVSIDPAILHTWPVDSLVLAGEYPFTADGNPKKLGVLTDAGYNVFIDLTHPSDKLTSYTDKLPKFGFRSCVYMNHPILDNGVVELDAYFNLISVMRALLLNPQNRIYLHCWGGVGRTATVAACYLIASGAAFESSEALFIIRKARKGTQKEAFDAPATEAQRHVIELFSRSPLRKLYGF